MINKIADIEKLKQCFSQEKKNIEVLMANQILALTKARVFNTTKGTEGEFFGAYRSEQYKVKRKKEGHQTDYKDLQFSNEFRDDLQIGESENMTVVGWSSEKNEDIAIGQENGSIDRLENPVKQINFTIFMPSDKEADIAIEVGLNYMQKLLDKCLTQA